MWRGIKVDKTFRSGPHILRGGSRRFDTQWCENDITRIGRQMDLGKMPSHYVIVSLGKQYYHEVGEEAFARHGKFAKFRVRIFLSLSILYGATVVCGQGWKCLSLF